MRVAIIDIFSQLLKKIPSIKKMQQIDRKKNRKNSQKSTAEKISFPTTTT